MAEFESVVDYTTKLNNFEGPLDLLLYLVKSAEIEIRDIFISDVTEQYLEYIRCLDEIDVDKASEYLNMASILLEIKAKELLPQPEEENVDIEDPKEALFRHLEEYKMLKEAGEKLKNQENVDRFYKNPDKTVGEVKIVYNEFNLDSLIEAFQHVLLRLDERQTADIGKKEIVREAFTVKEKIEFIRTTLLDHEHISFFELFGKVTSRNEVITTFQAMLELLKLQYIKVEQTDTFEDITITLREDRSEELGEIDEYN